MKKVIGLIVLAMVVILPIKANAAEFSVYMDCPKTSDGKLDITWADSQKLTGAVTCQVKADLTSGASLKEMKLTITPTDPKIVSVRSAKGSGTWTTTGIGQTTTSSTSEYEVTFTSTQAVSGSVVTIGSVVIDVKKAAPNDNCDFSYTPCVGSSCFDKVIITEKNICKIVNGTYYGKNGNVVTEEVYNAECVTNPQTGNFVPYALIAAGIALAIGVFTISRKNTKLYKI